MSELSWAETMRRAHQRAENRCEYCQTAQRVIGQAMHVEHIYPDGPDALENLCLSCPSCNLSKAQAGFAQKVTVCQVFLCRIPSCTKSVAVLDMKVYHSLWFYFYEIRIAISRQELSDVRIIAFVQGIHILAHGNKAEARRIAIDIQQNQRLLIGTNSV